MDSLKITSAAVKVLVSAKNLVKVPASNLENFW